MLHRFDLQVELDIQTWTSALDLEHAQCTEASSLCLFSEQFNSFLFGRLLFKKINQPKGQNSCSRGALQILNIQIFIRSNQNQRL